MPVPATKIKASLADREFIGKTCFCILQERFLSFCIRVKKDTKVVAGSGTWGPTYWLFKDLPVARSADGRTETHGTVRAPGRILKLMALLPLAFILAHLAGLWSHGWEGSLRFGNPEPSGKEFFCTAWATSSDCCFLRAPRRRPSSLVSGFCQSLSELCGVHRLLTPAMITQYYER